MEGQCIHVNGTGDGCGHTTSTHICFHSCTGTQSPSVRSPLPRLFFLIRIHTKYPPPLILSVVEV